MRIIRTAFRQNGLAENVIVNSRSGPGDYALEKKRMADKKRQQRQRQYDKAKRKEAT